MIAAVYRLGAAFVPLLLRSGALLAQVAGVAISLTLGAAAIAIGMGVYTVMDSVSSAASKFKTIQDGLIDSNGGLVISGPKGSFITDRDDKLLLSPDADKLVEGGGGGGITKADINAIANRPIQVQMVAGTDTILKFNTALSQYASPSLFA